jgi:hypothetical protein
VADVRNAGWGVPSEDAEGVLPEKHAEAPVRAVFHPPSWRAHQAGLPAFHLPGTIMQAVGSSGSSAFRSTANPDFVRLPQVDTWLRAAPWGHGAE